MSTPIVQVNPTEHRSSRLPERAMRDGEATIEAE